MWFKLKAKRRKGFKKEGAIRCVKAASQRKEVGGGSDDAGVCG